MVICVYCGEEEGTQRIGDPNLDMGEKIDWQDNKNWWMVCKDCKEVIFLQRMNSIGVIAENESIINDTNEKLMAIAERTGKPIMMASIQKKKDGKYNVSSVEFTGEKIIPQENN